MNKYTPYFLLPTLVIVTFSPLFVSFFQQDEWLAFGYHYLVEQQGFSSFLKNAFIPRLGHFSPLNYVVEFLLFLQLRLHFVGWAAVSVVLHIFNTLLVYVLSYQVLKKRTSAIAAAAVFGVSLAGVQATAWPVANIGTHGATLFALLSFIFWIKKGTYTLFVSIIALFLSLGFKETAVAFFIIYPLWVFLHPKARKKTRYLIIGSLLLVFMLTRLAAFLVPSSMLKGTIYDQPADAVGAQSTGKLIYNVFTFPVKGTVQSIVPPQLLITLSQRIASVVPTAISGEPLTTARDIFVIKYVVEALNLILFGVLVILAAKSGKVSRMFLLFTMLNAVIYAFSPGREGRITLIDSRNLYFLTATSVVSLTYILKRTTGKAFASIAVLIVIGNAYFTYSVVRDFARDSYVRKELLTQIIRENPNLPQKVLFYMHSDTSYYGLSESDTILPFQSGLGQTLLVWYYESERFPEDFMQGKFLWGIKDQGYREYNGRGFGYVREYDTLLSIMKEHNLEATSVISYDYYGRLSRLKNTTQDTRKILQSYD